MPSAFPSFITRVKSKKTSTVDEHNRHQRRFAVIHILDVRARRLHYTDPLYTKQSTSLSETNQLFPHSFILSFRGIYTDQRCCRTTSGPESFPEQAATSYSSLASFLQHSNGLLRTPLAKLQQRFPNLQSGGCRTLHARWSCPCPAASRSKGRSGRDAS